MWGPNLLLAPGAVYSLDTPMMKVLSERRARLKRIFKRSKHGLTNLWDKLRISVALSLKQYIHETKMLLNKHGYEFL